MDLKRYQERVVREVGVFLDALAAEQAAGARRPSLDAWEKTPHTRLYAARKNGVGEDLPSICLKVPTGGGKTLLATLLLGRIHRTILRARNGAGLVLWVVPSEQIYTDTLKALRDRDHPYRQTLEGEVGRRIEVWEKHEVARLSPARLATALNVLVMQLGSTNRETKEQLKFFRDSGGNIVQHFPAEDDLDAQDALRQRTPNLDVIDGTRLVKTSIANLVRLCRPAVILDEGHKAASELAHRTIEGMNPSIVVELSATPPADANVIVSVSGTELLNEEMIKLPINVVNTTARTWKECLGRAVDQRKALAEAAKKARLESGRHIRPIVLVQVERTGKEQRDGQMVHALDVQEELCERHGIPADRIALKTSGTNDIEGVDLLDDGCVIEWIITKAALQEGWDCPYAYILVSLSGGRSTRAMTQLVGRVLRQPEARRTSVQALNESYVFCQKRNAGEVVQEVKTALEKEGYQGDFVSQSAPDGEEPKTALPVARIRREFAKHYKKFNGKVWLPRFCFQVSKNQFESFDYFRHLLARVDLFSLDGSAAAEWALDDDLRRAGTIHFTVGLGGETGASRDEMPAHYEADGSVIEWLSANLGADYLGLKESRTFVVRVIDVLLKAQPQFRGNLALVKHVLREKAEGLVQEQVDQATAKEFKQLIEKDVIRFYLHCVDCRFEIPSEIALRPLQKRLVRDDNGPIQRSLFDFVPDTLNELEKEIALVLDRDERVLWWYRNLVGSENFAIQGFHRNRVYPDFVVQTAHGEKPAEKVVVIESKGAHLAGNKDTAYKRQIAEYFTKVGKAVRWQDLGVGFADHVFRFQVVDQGGYAGGVWREELRKLMEGSPG